MTDRRPTDDLQNGEEDAVFNPQHQTYEQVSYNKAIDDAIELLEREDIEYKNTVLNKVRNLKR